MRRVVGAHLRQSSGKALLAIATGIVTLVAASCGGDEPQSTPTTETVGTTTSATEPAGFEERFAQYEPASEPNGDLSKVVWPDYVLNAPPEVKELYEFQVTHGDLMRWMPCFCGCGRTAGHRSNRDCYIRRVNADGSVVFDPMAPTWGVCLGVTRAVMDMLEQGMSPREMRIAIDTAYASQIEASTPTPYPPA